MKLPVLVLGLFAGTAVAAAVTAWREPRVSPPVWVAIRVSSRYPGWYFSSERLHRAYSTRRACEHALPLSGMQTRGRTTARVTWYCERVTD